MALRIRKGDTVAVISGDDRGKRGRVIEIQRDKNRVVVEGVNLIFKHIRKSQKYPQGGRIRREAAIHLSNVMPIDPESGNPTRVTQKIIGDRKVRVGRRSGAPIDSGVRATSDGKED
jgi:large subunit ribosomal protein L24